VPWLIALKGAPGSGKSTLGRALSRQLGWPLIDKDDVKDLLDGHTSEAGGLAYEIMFNVVRRQLLQGLSVICDSPLAYRRAYEHATEIANETSASLAIIECCCPDENIWRERINARTALHLPAHHTTDWDAVQSYRRRTADEARYPIMHPHLVVNTLRPIPELCAQAVAWLEEQSPSS
jgi:predicted kinase